MQTSHPQGKNLNREKLNQTDFLWTKVNKNETWICAAKPCFYNCRLYNPGIMFVCLQNNYVYILNAALSKHVNLDILVKQKGIRKSTRVMQEIGKLVYE